VARGFLYLVPYEEPEGYEAYEGCFGAVAMSPSGATLYATADTRVIAFNVDLSLKRERQEDIWRYGSYIVLDHVTEGAIVVSAQFDIEGPWTVYVLAEPDGKLLHIGSPTQR
jgi:hypothetical protein